MRPILTDNLSKISYFLFERPSPQSRFWERWLFLFLVLIANAFSLNYFAFRGFNFFDYGGFLDASWRVYQGQIPYRDFIYIVGPIHLYMNAFFFLFFGFGKLAILAHLIIVSATVIMATFLVTYRKLPFFYCAVSTLLSCVGFYWWFPHPWYDHSAFLWMIVAISIICSHDFENQNQRSDLLIFACGFLCMWSVMTKTNIGIPFTLVSMVYFSTFKSFRLLLGFALGLLLGITVVFILVGSPRLLLDNTFFNFGAGATRQLIRFMVPETFFKNYYWVPALIVLLNAFRIRRTNPRLLLFFLGVIAVAIFSLNTGSLREQSNIALFGISTAIAFRLLYEARHQESSKSFSVIWRAISISALVAISLWQIYFNARYSFQRTSGLYPYLQVSDQKIQKGPLKGWLLSSAEDGAVNDMMSFIEKNIPEQEPLLILTDLQILYSMTGRESFRGVPFLFTVGVVPAPGKQLQDVRETITQNPPNWILTHRDPGTTGINQLVRYLGIEPFIAEHYQLVQYWNRYGMFRKIK